MYQLFNNQKFILHKLLNYLGENGEFLKEGTEVFLQAAVDKFADLVNRYKA